MALFEYTGVKRDSGGSESEGTVVAKDKIEAFDKVMRMNLTEIKLKRVSGLQAFMASAAGAFRG